jgi:hypothetical protein
MAEGWFAREREMRHLRQRHRNEKVKPERGEEVKREGGGAVWTAIGMGSQRNRS